MGAHDAYMRHCLVKVKHLIMGSCCALNQPQYTETIVYILARILPLYW